VYTLRLSHVAEGSNQHRVEVVLEGNGLPRQAADSRFPFVLSAQDQEDLRWYLEDYLQYPLDPAPNIARRIEGRMAEVGRELFSRIFQSDGDASDLWATLRLQLNDTRVEIVAGVREATTIPWELIRDPKTDTPLALRAQSFVRASPQAAQRARLPQKGAGPIRVLLVICRPGGRHDVPFRSVANRLLKGLGEAEREAVHLDVLRPPTFEQLGRVLRAAKARGEPYHIVHFDGHGGFGEGGPRAGAHGYLMFENAALDQNVQPVGGTDLGKLLAETEVPVLVLNACRSAHAEPPPAPVGVSGGAESPHAEARAFGSLAQEIMDAGATGVVAMGYNVFVDTAAQFMADLYGPLAQGQTLGESVTLGRKQLASQPLRGIAFDPLPLQDWPVPVVFEAAPIALFPKREGAPKLTITLGKGEATPARGTLDRNLPAHPDAGFFGRDETLLALDRAFDTQSIVLLHAYAGSGKTTTAAEFARWYALTGGVEGPVLFTSFEQYKPLARVLDGFGNVFQDALEKAGIQWLALDDAERPSVALQVMQQVPVLWIWDNVEPVAGFPTGTASKWSTEEQRELADFLRAARDTKGKFLLTSRRDERGWLGDLPARINVPPMPFQERVQLARALAEKHGRRLTDVQDWRPLLEFTQGNPMTVTVLVGQALRDGLRTRTQIEAFVGRLRTGEAVFKDEASEGRTRSLAASLSYGFEHAFSEAERKQLALLHLFQGFVDVDVLRFMGNPKEDWHLLEVHGITRETAIALLDRAAEVGLLTAHGGGYYSIHPALPWFFKKLFDEPYSDSQARASRAFVASMSSLGNYYTEQYEYGNRDVIGVLAAEEANLLYTRDLARTHGWWAAVISTMQGLRTLYDQTGRGAEWARLVKEIVPDFIDPATDGPLPGREEEWSIVTGYRVHLDRQARQWAEAEHLLRLHVDWDRRRASTALVLLPEELDTEQRNRIQTLGASMHELGEIQREVGDPDCVESYKEGYELVVRINDAPHAAVAALNLGTAYMNVPEIRNLDEAERWHQRSLELRAKGDELGRARSLAQLGAVAYQRFSDGRKAAKPGAELRGHLNSALGLYMQALDLFPPNAIGDLAVIHHQIGNIYNAAGDLDRALEHYRKSIGFEESAGNIFGAAQSRYIVASALAQGGRFADAKEYAVAALRNYETYGAGASKEIQNTLELIAQIDKDLKAESAGA